MSLNACAAMVRSRDPDRFLSAMTAPPELRSRLMVLYAFNLEIGRAAWASDQALIGEMRLQFWLDILESAKTGKAIPAHEVATPLVDLILHNDLPAKPFEDLIAARKRDIHNQTHADVAALMSYINATAGGLMRLAAQALGGRGDVVSIAERYGLASGIAAFLLALPALKAQSRDCLPELPPEQVIRELAETGIRAVSEARAERGSVPKQCHAAFRSGWMAKPVLRQAVSDPERVWNGTLGLSEFVRKSRLLLLALSQRW